MPRRSGADSCSAVRSENDSSPMAINSTAIGNHGTSIGSGC